MNSNNLHVSCIFLWCATQNSLNILAPLYAATRGWNATLIASVYTFGSLISIVVQFILNKYIATHSVKKAITIFGWISIALAVFLSLAMQQAVFCIIYVCKKICQDMWALVANGVMAGQWFPRRKGYVMGIETFGFPLASGLGMAIIGMLVFKSTFMAFLPFLIMGVIAMILVSPFLSDYPEEVGSFRDNDRSMTMTEAMKHNYVNIISASIETAMSQTAHAIGIYNIRTKKFTYRNKIAEREYFDAEREIVFALGDGDACSEGHYGGKSLKVDAYLDSALKFRIHDNGSFRGSFEKGYGLAAMEKNVLDTDGRIAFYTVEGEGFGIIIEWDEFELVGIAEDGLAAAELREKTHPDIVVIDMQMPKLSGAEAIGHIKKSSPDVRVLVFTTFDDSETALQAMAAGCDGFLLKVIDAEKLRASLLSIYKGIGVYDEGVMSRLQKSMVRNMRPSFTNRELTIMACVCRGMANSEMAAEMGLRTGTVKNLISLLLNKTNCISRSQLARYATENNFV